MTDEHNDPTHSEDAQTEDGSGSFIDDEIAGKHGTVASQSSLEDEKQIALHPQNVKEAVEKIRQGSQDDSGLLGTMKKTLQEVDRQVSGEYEHREDVEAEGDPPDDRGNG